MNKLQIPQSQRRRIRALIRQHSEESAILRDQGKQPPTLRAYLEKHDVMGKALAYGLDPATIARAERGGGA